MEFDARVEWSRLVTIDVLVSFFDICSCHVDILYSYFLTCA